MIPGFGHKKKQISSIKNLVGGFNRIEKYQSMGRIIPYIMENSKNDWNHKPVVVDLVVDND